MAMAVAVATGTAVRTEQAAAPRRRLTRNGRRARWLHAGTYLTTLVLLGTGWWLGLGREGQPSPLATLVGRSDAEVHTWVGWALAALGLAAPLASPRATAAFLRASLRFHPGDLGWLARWPLAALSGRFPWHRGHFDPGQRLANLVMVGGLACLTLSGVGLVLVTGGPAFVWLARAHRWAAYALTPVLIGHVLVAAGLLPGYRGAWRAMHGRGEVDEATARRLWPAWSERALERQARD